MNQPPILLGTSSFTAKGWEASFYPKGIPIGVVTKVGQTDVDPFQDVQVQPNADFTSLDMVLVLASNKPRPKMP